MAFFLSLMKWYCLIHIVITVCFDSQTVVPDVGGSNWHPKPLQNILREFYVKEYKDPFVIPETAQPWFKSLVWSEVTLQFAYILLGLYAFSAKKNWIRIPSIIYGTHVATTMFPIYAELFFGKWGLSDAQKTNIFFIYLPYLIIPTYLVIYMWLHPTPFPSSSSAPKKKSN
eukprot:TRINITY_DN2047_c0_g1_i1.p1 TRINITY_DN2047_c0_g1~~TRINITY_DN2047_c0_g1_i1.p1  ORF type:complete len:171 (+),score=53.57 TRINITY_DN2047_c0_g1_i1:67-579(+)